jgi:hypothetical protein
MSAAATGESERRTATDSVLITALGQKSGAARDTEVILVAYLSPLTRQQLVLSQHVGDSGWRVRPATVRDVQFSDCLLSRKGEIVLPRLQGGVIAAISHPWSGVIEINSGQCIKQIDLYSEVTKTILIDMGDGATRDFDAKEVLRFRSSFLDATSDLSLADQREQGEPRQAPLVSAIVTRPLPEQARTPSSLGWVIIRAVGARAELSSDELVSIVELEPVAGVIAELGRIDTDSNWAIKSQRSPAGMPLRALTSRNGELTLRAAPDGSVVFLRGPDAGFVDVEIFGITRRIDLYAREAKTLRLQFDEDRLPVFSATPTATPRETDTEAREFYAACLQHIDPSLPTGLYVPRWKGVASSTRNLFQQTMPFPPTAEGHPSEVTPEELRYYARVLLASGCRHFVISGGDLFWISIIRRVQWEDPRIRFDLIWHSNYLQMGEAHDWNLLKNWMGAINDGLVTRVAVVKSGLELLFRRLGIDTLFIPNIIRKHGTQIAYNGAHDTIGIWLSGSSSYRKVPFASLLALAALPGMRLIGAGFDDVSLAMVTDLKIPRGEISRQPLPQEALYAQIQKTGLTLYVTLSECSPMLPLESLHLGVPCLVGANSHLFRDHPYLYEKLVVESPLSPECIATKARGALADGEQVIQAFGEYRIAEERLAADAVARFLS